MQIISESSCGTAPRVQSAVSRPRRRTHCRALPVARRMQRPLVVQVQPLERLADLAFPPHSRTSSRPQIYQRCVHARRAVEGSPRSAARPMRAQTRAASPPCSVPVHMLHKLVPQPRAQVRPHLLGEAGEPGALTSALQRCAVRRRARRESVGEVAAMLEDVLEGARRAGGGVGGRRGGRGTG
eukprot:scaffold6811_cov55-Phaeocystis_antarctica.AAC.1